MMIFNAFWLGQWLKNEAKIKNKYVFEISKAQSALLIWTKKDDFSFLFFFWAQFCFNFKHNHVILRCLLVCGKYSSTLFGLSFFECYKTRGGGGFLTPWSDIFLTSYPYFINIYGIIYWAIAGRSMIAFNYIFWSMSSYVWVHNLGWLAYHNIRETHGFWSIHFIFMNTL